MFEILAVYKLQQRDLIRERIILLYLPKFKGCYSDGPSKPQYRY